MAELLFGCIRLQALGAQCGKTSMISYMAIITFACQSIVLFHVLYGKKHSGLEFLKCQKIVGEEETEEAKRGTSTDLFFIIFPSSFGSNCYNINPIAASLQRQTYYHSPVLLGTLCYDYDQIVRLINALILCERMHVYTDDERTQL